MKASAPSIKAAELCDINIQGEHNHKRETKSELMSSSACNVVACKATAAVIDVGEHPRKDEICRIQQTAVAQGYKSKDNADAFNVLFGSAKVCIRVCQLRTHLILFSPQS